MDRRNFLSASIAFAFFAYRVQIDNLGGLTTSARALAIVVIGVAFVSAGAITYSDRYPNRFGLLMVATGFALLARQFRYSHHGFLFTTFFALGDVGYAMVGHAALAYPTGRLRARAEKWKRFPDRAAGSSLQRAGIRKPKRPPRLPWCRQPGNRPR